jgi:hypothetical protein
LIAVLLAPAATSQAKGTAPKTTKVASRPHPVANPDRDRLMHIEENQKTLQRQFLILSATSERSANELNRRIDRLTDQLQRLASSMEKPSDPTQLLMIMQSTGRLLRFIVGLLLLQCSAIVVFGLQLRKSRYPFTGHRKTDEARKETPDGRPEAQWKVGL